MSVTKPYLYFSPSSATFSRVSIAAIRHAPAARAPAARASSLDSDAISASTSASVEVPAEAHAQRAARELSDTPIAPSTCDGATLPDEQAAPELTQHAVEIERHHRGFRGNAGMAKQEVFGWRSFVRAEDDCVRVADCAVALRNGRAARRHARSRIEIRLQRARGGAEARDAGDILRAGAAALFLRAVEQRRQAARLRARSTRPRLAARRSCAPRAKDNPRPRREADRAVAARHRIDMQQRALAAFVRRIAASAATAWITPVSLFATISDTSARPLPSSAANGTPADR